MVLFAAGAVAGMFVGCTIGVVVMAALAAAGDADNTAARR
jgi:hypothetical protein